MATKSEMRQDNPDTRNYTPTADKTAGDIVEDGGIAGQVKNDIIANELGAIRVAGHIRVNKTHPGMGHPINVYWDNDGTDVGGATGGAATAILSEGDFLLGSSLAASGTNVAYVDVDLNRRIPVSVVDLNAGTDSGTMPAACAAGTYDETIAENALETLLAVLRKTGSISI
jgi:hypothetical protein